MSGASITNIPVGAVTRTITICAYDPEDAPSPLPSGRNVFVEGSAEEQHDATVLPPGTIALSYRVEVTRAFTLTRGGAIVADIGLVSGNGHDFEFAYTLANVGENGFTLDADMLGKDIGGEQVRVSVRSREGVTGTEELDGPTIASLDGTELDGTDLAGSPFTATFTTPTTFDDVIAAFVGSGGPRPFLTPEGYIAIPCQDVDDASSAAPIFGFDGSNSTGTMPDLDKLVPSTSGSPSAGGLATIRVVTMPVVDTTF